MAFSCSPNVWGGVSTVVWSTRGVTGENGVTSCAQGGQARPFDLETGRRHHFAQVAEAHMAAPGARHRSAATPQSKLLVEERSPEQSPVPLFR